MLVFEHGSDNISMDRTTILDQNGRVSLNGKFLTIDNKHYKLRSTKETNEYRSKGYIFKLIYVKDELVGISKRSYDKTFNYYVTTDERNTLR